MNQVSSTLVFHSHCNITGIQLITQNRMHFDIMSYVPPLLVDSTSFHRATTKDSLLYSVSHLITSNLMSDHQNLIRFSVSNTFIFFTIRLLMVLLSDMK